MTKTEQNKLKRLVKLLRSAAELADELEVCVGNGGEVGSMVGSMADELEIKLEEAQCS